jgi:cytochrome c
LRAAAMMMMTKLRLVHGLALCSAILLATMAVAQISLPVAKPPEGATLFKLQCATCHTINPFEPVRQGPPLSGVVGRQAGKVEGFHYSPGLAKADFAWDEARLDAWLTNPQAMIPDAFMAYRQAKPETRAAIIAYLKELN